MSVSFLFRPFFALFCPYLRFFVRQSSLARLFGCTFILYVPRLRSWCYLVASDKGWYTTGRYSSAPFACWYCGVRIVLLAFCHRDVYCSLCNGHGLDFQGNELVM